MPSSSDIVAGEEGYFGSDVIINLDIQSYRTMLVMIEETNVSAPGTSDHGFSEN